MNGPEPAMPLADALEIVDRAMAPGAVSRRVLPVREALGQTLAADQLSRLQLPPFDKSAMDGYAILPDDRQERYQVLENVPAGKMPTVSLRPAAAVKVMTGARCPLAPGWSFPSNTSAARATPSK